MWIDTYNWKKKPRAWHKAFILVDGEKVEFKYYTKTNKISISGNIPENYFTDKAKLDLLNIMFKNFLIAISLSIKYSTAANAS